MRSLSASLRIAYSLLVTAAIPLAPSAAVAQQYPSQPIRLIAPSPAGGGTDLIARLVARHLAPKLGQPVIVDNKTGAAGLLGTTYVARSPADGYTLLLTYQVHAVNPWLIREMPFDALEDFQPVTQLVTTPPVLLVNAELPVRTMAEFVAYAKARPGTLNFGSAGRGGNGHLTGELLKQLTGINSTHVPYKGSAPMMMDLVGGNLQYAFDSISTASPHIKSGKLRALAIADNKRSPLLPDVPTAAEAGYPGLNSVSWYGVLVPKGTPVAITNLLHHQLVEIMRMPEVVEAMVTTGYTPTTSQNPEIFRTFLKSEIDRWGKIVKAAGITPE